MLWRKKQEDINLEDVELDEGELDNEEFFMTEEIDGYSSCSGLNAQKCSSDCFRAVMMPTITVIS